MKVQHNQQEEKLKHSTASNVQKKERENRASTLRDKGNLVALIAIVLIILIFVITGIISR